MKKLRVFAVIKSAVDGKSDASRQGLANCLSSLYIGGNPNIRGASHEHCIDLVGRLRSHRGSWPRRGRNGRARDAYSPGNAFVGARPWPIRRPRSTGRKRSLNGASRRQARSHKQGGARKGVKSSSGLGCRLNAIEWPSCARLPASRLAVMSKVFRGILVHEVFVEKIDSKMLPQGESPSPHSVQSA